MENLKITGRLKIGKETFSGVILSDKATQKLFKIFDPDMDLKSHKGGGNRGKKEAAKSDKPLEKR